MNKTVKQPFAKRSLGQNFLVDTNYQRKIISAVQSAYRGETVVEIGPGRGALTEHLRSFASHLVLIEKDKTFAADLAEKNRNDQRVSVVAADFLDWDLAGLGSEPALVVANLPYNVSTQILIKLLQNMRHFTRLFLMFQKEVALRCVAQSNSKDFGILSVWCQTFASPKRLFDVPPNAFRPRPNVTSSIVEFAPSEIIFSATEKSFIDFVKRIFSQRRKKVATLLKPEHGFLVGDPVLAELLERRAEALSLSEMRQLFAAILKFPVSH